MDNNLPRKIFSEYFEREILKKGFLKSSVPHFLEFFKQEIQAATDECILETKRLVDKDFQRELIITIAYQVRYVFKNLVPDNLINYFDALVKVYRSVLYSILETKLKNLNNEDLSYIITSVEDDILLQASKKMFSILSQQNKQISKIKFQEWLHNERNNIQTFVQKSLIKAYSETYIDW